MAQQDGINCRSFALVHWMLCLATFILVWGHVADASFSRLTAPIFPAQLGFAGFVFVLGWVLARDRRDALHVVYARLFPVYLYGLLTAVALTAVMAVTRGTLNPHALNLSNYQPFVFGGNALLNHFPANPTMWFIGTFLHLILLWALLLRRLRITGWLIAAAAIAEIMFRAGMLNTEGHLRAYMLLPNWLTVFLLGMWGARSDKPVRSWGILGWGVAWAVFAVGWAWLAHHVPWSGTFPFREIQGWHGQGALLVRSAAVTLLYAGHVWLAYEVIRRLPALAPVRFFAGSTLAICLGFMPLLFVLREPLEQVIPDDSHRGIVLLVLLYGGLSLIGAGVNALVRPTALADALWRRLTAHRRPSPRDQMAMGPHRAEG